LVLVCVSPTMTTAATTPTPTPKDVVQVKVQCTVCCEAFTSEGEHAPLVLSGCGHTFCEACLQGVAKQTASRKICCPTCRTPCDLDTDIRRNWRLAEVIAGEGVLLDSGGGGGKGTHPPPMPPSAPPAEHMVFASPAPAVPVSSPPAVEQPTYSYLPFRVVREEAVRIASTFAARNSSGGDAAALEVRLTPALVPFFAVVVTAQARVEAMGDAAATAAFTEEADIVRDGLVCAWAADKERRLVEECFPPTQPVWDLQTLRTASTTVPESVPWLPAGADLSQHPQPRLCPYITPDDAIERFRAACQADTQRESERRAAELRKTSPQARGCRLQASAFARVARRRLVYVAFWIGTYGGINAVFVDGITGRVGGEVQQRRRVAETILKVLGLSS